jgi:hypothetical protein
MRWYLSMWLFDWATRLSPTYKAEITEIEGNTIKVNSSVGLQPRDVILIKRTR